MSSPVFALSRVIRELSDIVHFILRIILYSLFGIFLSHLFIFFVVIRHFISAIVIIILISIASYSPTLLLRLVLELSYLGLDLSGFGIFSDSFPASLLEFLLANFHMPLTKQVTHVGFLVFPLIIHVFPAANQTLPNPTSDMESLSAALVVALHAAASAPLSAYVACEFEPIEVDSAFYHIFPVIFEPYLGSPINTGDMSPSDRWVSYHYAFHIITEVAHCRNCRRIGIGSKECTPLTKPVLFRWKLVFDIIAVARLMHCRIAKVTYDQVVFSLINEVILANIT